MYKYNNHSVKRKAFNRFLKIHSNILHNKNNDAGNGRTFRKKFFTDLCNNLSFHGLNHFVDDEITTIERTFWALLIVSVVIGAAYSILQFWFHYIHSSIETVVDTTYFRNSDISFPAVIICDASRVDWSKVISLNESNMPEYSNETEPAIRELLKSLANVEFGNFDEFDGFVQYREILPKLNTIRISDLLLKVARTCDETFSGGRCWFRNHEIDCCNIFELHKTEFGYCYAFNSDLSESSKKMSRVKNGINSYWKDPDGIIRPRRTGSRGPWSGLHVTVSTPSVNFIPPDKNIKPGIKVLVGEPRTYLMGGEMILTAGQYGNVHVWGDRIFTTDRLRDMDQQKRQCLYSDEAEALGLPYYLRQNCKTDCFKYHTYKYCNCSPDFVFFEVNENNPAYPPCTVEDLLCLNKHNSIFNHMIPNFAHSFFEGNESGMFCDCKADCTHQMYTGEIAIVEESNSTEEVVLDVHFRHYTCILYRSDVTFAWLDLLVSFGGCTGLFLGGSLVSYVELIYFITLRLFFQYRRWIIQRRAS